MASSRRVLGLAIAIAGFGLPACGSSERPPEPVDSGPWWVDPVPILDIGSATGPESNQLYGVRAARLLDDGTLVIANAGSGEVRFYSEGGELIQSLGARGEGPGEFQNLRRFWITEGDTTIAFDAGDRTLVTFGPDGELVSDRTLERREGLGTPDVLGRFADGTLVVRDAPSHSRTTAGTLSQDTAAVALYDSSGRFRHHISERPGRLLFVYETPGMVHLSPLHFGAVPTEAVGDSVILFHDGVSSTIELLTRTGAPHGTLHLGMRAVPPLGEELAAYRRNLLDAAQTREQRRAVQLRLDVVPFAKLKPTLIRILVDPAGDVWAQRFQTDREGPSRWAVFRNGRLLGDVEVPGGVSVLSINGPRLVGRWRDDLGVEHVRVHALIRRSETDP